MSITADRRELHRRYVRDWHEQRLSAQGINFRAYRQVLEQRIFGYSRREVVWRITLLSRRGPYRNRPTEAAWSGRRRRRVSNAGLRHDPGRADFGFRAHVLQVLSADIEAPAEGIRVEEPEYYVL